MAAYRGRDKAHVHDIIVIGRRNPLNGSYKLGEPTADQLMRSWSGTSRLPGTCVGTHLLIVLLVLTVPAELVAPLVQLVDELNNPLSRTSVQKCHPQRGQRNHCDFARCAHGSHDGSPVLA